MALPTEYYAPWNNIALTAATAKTMLELPTAANRSIAIKELVVSIDVTSTTAILTVEFGTFTTTGTGTALTPQKWNGNLALASSALGTAKVNDTVEPTGFSAGTMGGTLYPTLKIPLPAIPFFQWPLSDEFTVPASTNFALRITSSVAGNTSGWLRWDE